MLVELPDNLAAYEQEAHIYAARQLAQAYARHDREGGNLTGAAYWSARLVSGGIGGNMWAHIPDPSATLADLWHKAAQLPPDSQEAAQARVEAKRYARNAGLSTGPAHVAHEAIPALRLIVEDYAYLLKQTGRNPEQSDVVRYARETLNKINP